MRNLLPELEGVIRRRLLVNFRVDADVAQKLLPEPFRPKLVAGQAMAGICLIRLEAIRPEGFPKRLGMASENAAHRIAVVWDEDGCTREGVYIPRRDSNSFLNRIAGGRLFPGQLEGAKFVVHDDGDAIDLRMKSNDGVVRVRLRGHGAESLPLTSVFDNPAQASDFFEAGALGYSAKRSSGRLESVELQTEQWSATPFDIDQVESSFFSDRNLFPAGAVSYDCALVMRNIEHRWHKGPTNMSTSDRVREVSRR